jgi:AraC-like DNA-binding protein
MWSSEIIESADPDEFISFIRPKGCEILVTERGLFEARGILIDIGGLYLQRRRERLARLVEVDMQRSGIVFLTEPGPPMFWNGAEIGLQDLAMFSPGDRYVSRTSGSTAWGSMSLAGDDMDAVCVSYFGNTRAWNGSYRVITPSPGALARLRLLHSAAGQMGEASSKASASSASPSGLGQSLIQAMLECIDVPAVRSESTAVQHHRLIIRRFHETLEMDPLRALHVPETSQAIGISGRTLRMACQEQLGISPTQYLLLRRMRLARRALRRADPNVTTVTDIATDLGFGETSGTL